jgi:hypothetical protein
LLPDSAAANGQSPDQATAGVSHASRFTVIFSD